jgi:hypothetical protein
MIWTRTSLLAYKLVNKFIHQKNVNFEEMQQALNEYVRYEYACKLCFSKSRVS